VAPRRRSSLREARFRELLLISGVTTAVTLPCMLLTGLAVFLPGTIGLVWCLLRYRRLRLARTHLKMAAAVAMFPAFIIGLCGEQIVSLAAGDHVRATVSRIVQVNTSSRSHESHSWACYVLAPDGRELGPIRIGSETAVSEGSSVEVVTPAFGDDDPVLADQVSDKALRDWLGILAVIGITVWAAWYVARSEPTPAPVDAEPDGAPLAPDAAGNPVPTRRRPLRKRKPSDHHHD
jgi:hypothetical protein